MGNADLVWKCHVCGEDRADRCISVMTTTRVVNGVELIENVRYCNDREGCARGAAGGLTGQRISLPFQVTSVDHEPTDMRGSIGVLVLESHEEQRDGETVTVIDDAEFQSISLDAPGFDTAVPEC